jgi:hypothetical protein
LVSQADLVAYQRLWPEASVCIEADNGLVWPEIALCAFVDSRGGNKARVRPFATSTHLVWRT